MRRRARINVALGMALLAFTGVAHLMNRRAVMALRSHRHHVQSSDSSMLHRFQVRADTWQWTFVAGAIPTISTIVVTTAPAITLANRRRAEACSGFEVIR